MSPALLPSGEQKLLLAARIEAAEQECQRAERARDAAQKAVTAAYIELGRALLATEIGAALRRGRR